MTTKATSDFTKRHGTCEGVRYLLKYGGDKLGEMRETIEQWIKSVEEGKSTLDIHHAVTVARCMGTALGLITGDYWIDAKLETIAIVIYDILKYAESWYKEKNKEKKIKTLIEFRKNILDDYLQSLEKAVEDNGGQFSADKLTWLDFFFVGAMEVLEFYLGISITEGKYPALFKLAKKIWEMPEIKDYIKGRDFKQETQR